MSSRHVVAALLPLLVGTSAIAQTCPCGTGTLVTSSTQLKTLLSSNTVCAAAGSDTWQEYHDPSGTLTDYKRGPSDPVDPSQIVGTWSVLAGGGISRSGVLVRYDYGSGGVYQYSVCQVSANSVNFCGSTGSRNVTGATLQSGPGACISSAPGGALKSR